MLVKEMLNADTNSDIDGPVVLFEMPDRIRGVIQVAVTELTGNSTMSAAIFEADGRLSENHGWFEVASNMNVGTTVGSLVTEDIVMFPQMRVRFNESGLNNTENAKVVAYIGN